MAIAQGVNKQTRIKRQASKGTLAGVTLGQVMRRKQATFELAKDIYTTEDEITSTQQVKSARHGVRTVNGSIDGLLSPGTYSDPISSVLRKDFAAVTAIAGASITIAGTGPYTVTRAAGSFLTDGIKVGMVVRLTAGTFNAANLNNNLFVTAVTALVLTVVTLNASALVAEGPIASATVTVPGKVSYIPDTSQTAIYYTVEEWYPDIPFSERNQDVRFTKASFALPGSGIGTVKLDATGLDQTNATTVYYTGPTAESTSDPVVAASGILYVNGAAVATVTDLSIDVDGNGNPADGVVGVNIRPDVFVGKVSVKGQFTAYFDGSSIPSLFLNETKIAIMSALLAGSAANADFITFAMSNVKLSSSSPDDNQTGLKRTYSFISLYDGTGGAALANYATSLQVHDSLAA